MGQCMSRKAAGAFAASASVAHNKPTKGNKHSKLLSPEDDNRDAIVAMKKSNHNLGSKGVATSFGFKRRPTTAPSALTADNANAARRLANSNAIDSNGNDEEKQSLTAHAQPSGRSTPRLQPPKKEGIASQKVSRFGFRQPQINRTNKVADLNAEPIDFAANKNSSHVIAAPTNNVSLQNKYKAGSVGVRKTSAGTDNNSNPTSVVKTSVQANEINRYKLQSNQLPKPQPVRVMETKTAKTLANNNVKLADNTYRRPSPDYSSKDGSLTEDSGVGSHIGTDLDTSTQSPLVRRNKQRNLEVMLNGNTFDVRDMEDSVEVTLPKLPNVFGDMPEKSRVFQNTGVVRERTLEYERQLDKEVRRQISGTSSSEGFSDQFCQNELPAHKPQFLAQKSFIKPKPSPVKVFLKSKAVDNKEYSSSASSDEQEWAFAGEAMADEVSFSISSSDESKDRDFQAEKSNEKGELYSSSKNKMENKLFIKKALPPLPLRTEFQHVTLTIKDMDSTLEAAAVDNADTMLEDETSPIDSVLSFTESDEILRKKMDQSSCSKDINEKRSSSSPSTPTNASNSLSFSDGKDDFLIDDEIADQPALVFGDKSQHNSETTLIESTPRTRRKKLRNFDGSPLILKEKRSLRSSTVSLDTLSPCDSIASDDLMMDFDYSQSSGVEDYDKMDKKNEKFIYSADDTITVSTVGSIETEIKNSEQMRDWSALINYTNGKNSRCNSRPRFLRSRTGTPNAASDSPSSLDGRHRSRPSTTNSPLRRLPHASSLGYESDDSVVKLDRATHASIKNDIVGVKTMLLKLRRVLNEQTNEDILSMSETHNPFDSQSNGHFNGFSSETNSCSEIEEDSGRLELMDLRRQVLFLQGQLEDKENTVQSLQEQMTKMCVDNYLSNSAPASTLNNEKEMCNAATQTERIRPVSVGPSSNGSQVDLTPGSLVSATEFSRKTRTTARAESPAQRTTPIRERRKIGESVLHSAHRQTHNTSIPRRSESRSRVGPSTFT